MSDAGLSNSDIDEVILVGGSSRIPAVQELVEKFFGKKVFLEIFVKVEKDWRNRENKLRQFGYLE